MRIRLHLTMFSLLLILLLIVMKCSYSQSKEWEIYIVSQDINNFLLLKSSYVIESDNSESFEVYFITDYINSSYLLKQPTLNTSLGMFTVGALWYWNHPDPSTFFYYKETLSGVFEVSFSIVMEDITPSATTFTAPLAPSAPV